MRLKCVKVFEEWRGLDTNLALPSHKLLQCNIVDVYACTSILPAYRLERYIDLYGLLIALSVNLAECGRIKSAK